MDILFYNFNFELLHILPEASKNKGCTSINVTHDYCDTGSFEIDFFDDELRDIIEANKDEIILVWGSFQGYMTGYVWSEKSSKIVGKSLNALLHRVVVPSGEYSATIANIVKAELTGKWFTLCDFDEYTDFTVADYATDKYLPGDDWIEGLLKPHNAGYKLSADIVSKQFKLQILSPTSTKLELSEYNRNISGAQSTYDNKTGYNGGYWKGKDDKYNFISLDSQITGVKQNITVLSATEAADAETELRSLNSTYSSTFSTQSLEYGRDYELGDIVTLKIGKLTQTRIITSVGRYKEKSYGETPQLSEVQNG